jgi:hypothetical protein
MAQMKNQVISTSERVAEIEGSAAQISFRSGRLVVLSQQAAIDLQPFQDMFDIKPGLAGRAPFFNDRSDERMNPRRKSQFSPGDLER